MQDDTLLEIGRLGARGDGIAETAEGPRYVPFALPGERVRHRAGALPEVVSAASPERIAPLCRHFGLCGGCAGQHMRESLYARWKRDIVVEALRTRGLDAEVLPLQPIAPASRRRAVITAKREQGAIVLGYHPRDSEAVFDLRECPVLMPTIVERLPALREMAAVIAHGEVRFTVLATAPGLDIAIVSGRRIDAKQSTRLAQIAAEQRFARLTLDGQIITQLARPLLTLAGVEVCPPAGAFVQAVGQAEDLIVAEVAAATAKTRRAADLFCGLGTLTFRLARTALVAAFDSDRELIAALQSAARHAKGVKPIATVIRDLFRDPLSAKELAGFDAVIFDPPRAGAKAQAQQLARSQVPIVVAVSCNPGTLARDVRILVDGGYRLEHVTPIDQFVFSAHVEAIACLRRLS
jgi:23S rRNA (uracil1939-C5)-methyltransferase